MIKWIRTSRLSIKNSLSQVKRTASETKSYSLFYGVTNSSGHQVFFFFFFFVITPKPRVE